MLELGIVVVAIVGALWVGGALLAAVFKLTFGVLGALFGGVFALLGIGLVALLVLPFVLLALAPLWLPIVCVVGLAWWITRSGKPHAATPAAN